MKNLIDRFNKDIIFSKLVNLIITYKINYNLSVDELNQTVVASFIIYEEIKLSQCLKTNAKNLNFYDIFFNQNLMSELRQRENEILFKRSASEIKHNFKNFEDGHENCLKLEEKKYYNLVKFFVSILLKNNFTISELRDMANLANYMCVSKHEYKSISIEKINNLF